jgi:hypothetical protein
MGFFLVFSITPQLQPSFGQVWHDQFLRQQFQLSYLDT